MLFCSPRIERWTGGKWERLYYMPEEFSALCDEPARGYKEGVEEYPYPIGGCREATITVERQYFISPIKPGRYRVVV